MCFSRKLERFEGFLMPLRQVEIEKASLKIRISGLSNGLHDYNFLVEPSLIGLNGNFHSPVGVQAHLDKSARQIFLRAEIQTSGQFECDRCLDEFQLPLNAALTVVYLYDKDEAAKYAEEDIQILTPDTVYIDPTEDVRQVIILSVPLKLLCREECKGLCPRCGANLNHATCTCVQDSSDPRWNSLRGLIDQ